MQLESIGTVHSCFKLKFGTPRQGRIAAHSQGIIAIDKKWEPDKCLKGLEEFSHLWVLFWFHENRKFTYRPGVRPPRLSPKRVGLFASRSPLRPNPVGLSLVKIEKIESPNIYISGLDIIDGTPVLDIKPYVHAYDSAENSKSGWLDEVKSPKLSVEWDDEALRQLQVLPHPKLKETVEDILSSDIRSRNDKSAKHSDRKMGFYYEDLNIVFRVQEQSATVLYIENR